MSIQVFQTNPGIPIVLSGPSGVGKGTVIQHLMNNCPDLILSVSMTTRAPRPGEQDGVHYHFVTKYRFEEAIQNHEMAEWARVYDHYYGTKRSYLETSLQNGEDVLLDIDIQGAASIRTLYPNGLFVYLLPPSLDELKRRLYLRAKGEEDDLEHRFSMAQHEMRCAEMFDYWIINNDANQAANELKNIILSHRNRRERIKPLVSAFKFLGGSRSTQTD